MSETISTASAPPPPISSPPMPTLLELCAAFAIIALCGFGGVLAALQRMLVGVAAAAVGLVMGTCAKMALPLFKDPLGLAPLLALATLVSVGVLRWPLYWALGGLIPLSIAIAWVRR